MPKRIENFAELRGRIKAKGYTIGDLAADMGLSRSALSPKLCGKTSITLDEVYQIMKLLEIPSDQMHIYFPNERRA